MLLIPFFKIRFSQYQNEFMTSLPAFPEFKPVELSDRAFISSRMEAYRPETSELSFTNLYIWWPYYRTQWSMMDDCLILLCRPLDDNPFFLPPLSTTARKEHVQTALTWLQNETEGARPFIERADTRLAGELEKHSGFDIKPVRNHYDYIYRTEDLISLKGRKYHSKKNRLNKFNKTHVFRYLPLTPDLIPACIEVHKRWCEDRECEKNPIMRAESQAVFEILHNFHSLSVQGGVILLNNQVEAFTVGELLNPEMAVIHVEKADPGIPELFTVINQQFAEHALSGVPFINREQDLGEHGLRRAKESYHPVTLQEKFRITLKQA